MAGKVMHAVQYDKYGGGAGALKHVEVPIPSPKNEEVLLKLEAASINPVDWKIQKGLLRPFVPSKFPHIPVSDVAGEVVEVGSTVKNFKAGDKVVAYTGLKNGGLAEYAVASSNLTVHRPPQVPAADASGLLIAAVTALQALKSGGASFEGGGNPLNVLVTAASGGVGHYAVQLAKLANLHVTATCGSRNVGLVESLGADEVLDYKTPEGAALRSPSGRKYDAVVHCAVGGIGWSTFEPNLSDKGKVVDITPSATTFLNAAVKKLTRAKKRIEPLFAAVNEVDVRFLVGLMGEGKLRTVVDSRYPLGKAEEAWAKSMDGHATGKIVVEMRDG